MAGNMNQGTCSSSTSWAVKVLMKSIARTSSSSPTPYFLRTKKLYIYLVGFPTHRLAHPLSSNLHQYRIRPMISTNNLILSTTTTMRVIRWIVANMKTMLDFLNISSIFLCIESWIQTIRRRTNGHVSVQRVRVGRSWGSCPSICLSD